MNSKTCLILILAVGVVYVASSPLTAFYDSSFVGRRPLCSCIYEHATCQSNIVLRNGACWRKRKCCVTDFFSSVPYPKTGSAVQI